MRVRDRTKSELRSIGNLSRYIPLSGRSSSPPFLQPSSSFLRSTSSLCSSWRVLLLRHCKRSYESGATAATAVIIKQKTMLDADNKEEVRASSNTGKVGQRGRRSNRGQEGKDERKAIFSKVAGAKDVVPRTAIDLIRALPTLFPSSGLSLLFPSS